MTPSARISAAIEVLADLDAHIRPAADALKAWGLAHRFAGSGDRAAIASLVYDALRQKASAAFIMGEGTPRALVLGMLKRTRGLDLAAIEKLFSGERFAPPPIFAQEREKLQAARNLDGAPAHVTGDYPEWLEAQFVETFGDERAAEGAALAARAPLDLRVNSLKATREKLVDALSHLDPQATRWSPTGLRIPLSADGRHPPVTAEPAFQKGWFEVQDEGSQVAALLAGARAGEQVLDLCAGSGGKTLALAAAMENRGQIFAHDADLRRLAPIYDRIKRAEARNIQVRAPKGKADVLADLEGKIDLVLVDAPCTGTGVWRRHPDAKWRMRPGALAERVKEQAALLDQAARFAKPGGRIAYVTCSVLEAENGAQVRNFLARAHGWAIVPVAEVCAVLGERGQILRAAARTGAEGILLTPKRTDTDGFFVSLLRSGS
ncbi:MAG TPA: RsmB/NOP family class I SAM-dependent RNA methyltransferase [Xanthobacteraceae bacterium]|nr:RsmB/NOP family class I SAM-dependent RNA methyltransferase [Xanthobacteraceae bacterium]